MDSSHSSESSTAPSDLFSPTELAAFRQADTQAATAIVVLMLGIFTIGIALYLGVMYFVASAPQ